jgi:hypothetical protein
MGTVGTSHHDVKEEIQMTKFMSVRVPMHDAGAELPVVVLRRLYPEGHK